MGLNIKPLRYESRRWCVVNAIIITIKIIIKRSSCDVKLQIKRMTMKISGISELWRKGRCVSFVASLKNKLLIKAWIKKWFLPRAYTIVLQWSDQHRSEMIKWNKRMQGKYFPYVQQQLLHMKRSQLNREPSCQLKHEINLNCWFFHLAYH